MKAILFTFLISIWNIILLAQPVLPTDSQSRLDDFQKRKQLEENSLASELAFENIGPTIFSGRVTDIAVNPEDPSIFFVAYASGGLWKTENNGTTFSPIFDEEAVMTIGAIAVNWEENIIWIGTGEVNSSRSSYAGIGMYKSIDEGEHWHYIGLPESHHIGRILLHPREKDIAWVAVMGHLYSSNKERGVYKTMDGGVNWEKVLYIDENTGAVDLIMDPVNSDILYAATWHRQRRAWNFVESGSGSAIFKSEDGGMNWERKTKGFPEGEGVGRIGLAIGHSKGQSKIYALLDNYFRRDKEEEKEPDVLSKDDFKNMSKEDFLKLEDEKISVFLEENRFPEKYNVKKVKKLVKKDKIEVKALAEYLEDANRLLFDTPVIGAEVYASENGGNSWYRTHSDYLDGLYNSYGYYFGMIRVSPQNIDKIYIGGVPILKSEDGGKSFSSINQENVHADHHALWVNPNRDGQLINGNDGGINISYDDGEHWIKCNAPAVGQFYTVNVDSADPYHVYGGTQDNGVWEGSHRYRGGFQWHSTGQYPYKSLMGGDGMQVQIDHSNNEIVYTGFQFGNYFRINKKTGKRSFITPKHELGERPYRWNWQTPIHLSIHNQDILYMGAHKLFRSMNQGEDFEAISDDLTTGGKKGDVPYATLTSIHESPLKFGLIYTGSDDGLVYCTQDGGNTWQLISEDLPQDLWISRIQASMHEKSRVYATLNGYRWDNFNAYVYVSEDYGNSWTRIGMDLPAEPVNVIREDPEDENILYLGTDHGAYFSLNRGKSFMKFVKGLPHVPIHDLVIQPQAQHLLLGTHGRSIYKADISELQKLNAVKDEEMYVFEPDEIKYNEAFGTRRNAYSDYFVPETQWTVYVKQGGSLNLQIETSEGKLLKEWEVTLEPGLNYIEYDLSIDPSHKNRLQKFLSKDEEEKIELKASENGFIYLRPGKYQLKLKKEKLELVKELIIKVENDRS